MSEIIDYIKNKDVIFGLVFIVFGILAGVFKQYWFIAGVNTTSKKELEKVDIDYLTKFCGIWFCIIGLFCALSPFLFDHFNLKHRKLIEAIVCVSIITFGVLYLNVFNRKRVYKTGQIPPMSAEIKICGIICLIVLPVSALILFLAYKEPKVKINANKFKLIGLHGVNLPFSEIAAADTLVWSDMPKISRRTFGISLNEVHRGKFETANGSNVHLNIHSGVSPVIRIVGKDRSVYYINRRNANETREIFEKLNINNTFQ